jgi:magnesium transporter
MTTKAPEPKRSHHRALHRTPPGADPGTLILDPAALQSSVRLTAYSADKLIERELMDAEELTQHLHRWPVCWVDVEGLGNLTLVRKLGQIFGLHLLALEDVVNVHQRAKVEQYQDYLFIVVHMPLRSERGAHIETEQLSLFLGKDFVLTFQEGRPGDPLSPVRDRLRTPESQIRREGPDYLAYALLDAAIDAYFPVLEEFGERLETLEDRVLTHADSRMFARIHSAKRELLGLRRILWPHRDAVSALIRGSTNLIRPETGVYLRDCYDHIVRIIELLETYREVGSDLSDLYLTGVSNRTNDIMKVLTMIATIFIPLSFISGVYGMNFNPADSPWNMPELNWHYGYPFALTLMSGVAIGILAYFRKKGWIGAAARHRREESRDWRGAAG